MSPLTSARPGRGPAPDGPEPGARMEIHPRRSLPGSRSVVGGLLVATASLLGWWVAATAGQAPDTRYVVAARPIGPGQVVQPGDLALALAELPPTVRSRVFQDPDSVVGRVALGPVGTGELLATGSLTDDAPPPGERELTFPVDAAWALDGDLRPGDRIDVFATYGDGTTSQTLRVLAGATVRRTAAADGTGLGEGSGPTVTVGVDRSVSIETVVNATHAASLTVVRVTADERASASTDGPDTARYRAESDLAAAGPTGTGDTGDRPDPAAGP